MIKLESGDEQIDIVAHLACHDIPVCVHLGLKPQSVHKLGRLTVRGRKPGYAENIAKTARSLQDAGADLVLLECVTSELGKSIADAIDVPVIGIGAGPNVDGQILVVNDILHITQGRLPRFVHDFQKGRDSPLEALKSYVSAVRNCEYPAPEHCF